MSKPKRQRGAQPGNSNAWKSGHKSRNALRFGLKAGALPKGCRYITNHLNILRRNIEDALIKQYGKKSTSHVPALCRAYFGTKCPPSWH